MTDLDPIEQQLRKARPGSRLEVLAEAFLPLIDRLRAAEEVVEAARDWHRYEYPDGSTGHPADAKEDRVAEALRHYDEATKE